MLTTTQAYKDTMFANIRPPQYVDITVSVIDRGAADDVTITAIGPETWFSEPSTLPWDTLPDATYATFEPFRCKADGAQLIPSLTSPLLDQGYISDYPSGTDKVYVGDVGVRCSFSEERTFPAVTLLFDDTTEEYPAHVRVNGYRAGALIKTVDGYPDNYLFPVYAEDRSQFNLCDRVDILFLESNVEERRARLQRVIFGYLVEPTNVDIESLYVAWESDPISRFVPADSLSFTLLNFDGVYNPDNPFGIWKDMQDRIPINVSFGQTISNGMTWSDVYKLTWSEIYGNTWRNLYEGGGVERVPLGQWYLTSQPETNGRHATFNAVSIWGILDMTYYKGVWGPRTLYDLAVDVLTDANIPSLADGTPAWEIDESLKGFTTQAPLPIATARELLQLIANAAMCTMSVDREGHLLIRPIPTTDYPDYLLDFHDILDLPGVKLSPDLAGVEVSSYTYSDVQDSRELVNAEYETVAGEVIHFEFTDPIQNVSVSLGAPGTSTIYAHVVDVVPTSTGTMNITITAQSVRSITYAVRDAVTDAMQTAVWADFANPLITDTAWARKVAAWEKAYLLLRNTYSIEYKGHPEIEVLDSIHQETQFSDDIPVYVLKQELTFNGALWGSMEQKRRDT